MVKSQKQADLTVNKTVWMPLGRSTARVWAEHVNCQVERIFAAGVSEWNLRQ